MLYITVLKSSIFLWVFNHKWGTQYIYIYSWMVYKGYRHFRKPPVDQIWVIPHLGRDTTALQDRGINDRGLHGLVMAF